jgi:hypothetical protein
MQPVLLDINFFKIWNFPFIIFKESRNPVMEKVTRLNLAIVKVICCYTKVFAPSHSPTWQSLVIVFPSSKENVSQFSRVLNEVLLISFLPRTLYFYYRGEKGHLPFDGNSTQVGKYKKGLSVLVRGDSWEFHFSFF